MMKKILVASALTMLGATAMAANCSVSVDSTDSMQFNTQEITISKSCSEFSLTLHNVGGMPKEVMGHNLVITKEEDMSDVESEGISAGVENNYIAPGDSRVIAATRLLGGGESQTIMIPTSKLEVGGDYRFLCTFPGHSSIMNGVVNVTN